MIYEKDAGSQPKARLQLFILTGISNSFIIKLSDAVCRKAYTSLLRDEKTEE